MFKILTLNNISVRGLERLPRDQYEVASEMQHPDAVLVRSADMHKMEIPATVRAIGRAGAGVNNIPVEKMSARGIPVFNAPGANANAVKELVVAGMLIACRNLGPAWDFARALAGDDAALHKLTEAGKKDFAGYELIGPNGGGSCGMAAGDWRIGAQAHGIHARDDFDAAAHQLHHHASLCRGMVCGEIVGRCAVRDVLSAGRADAGGEVRPV